MHRIGLALCAVAMVIVAGGLLVGADKKSAKKAGKGLPARFSKLELTEEQAQKAREIHAKHRVKIAELRKQLAEAVAAERTELDAVLTEAQKAKLEEMRAKSKGKKKQPRISPLPEKKPADS